MSGLFAVTLSCLFKRLRLKIYDTEIYLSKIIRIFNVFGNYIYLRILLRSKYLC